MEKSWWEGKGRERKEKKRKRGEIRPVERKRRETRAVQKWSGWRIGPAGRVGK